MEAVLPTLPKLEAVGGQSKSPPIVRAWNRQAFKSGLDFSTTLLKFPATRRFMTLSGRGRRHLASSGPGLEVLLDNLAAQRFYLAADRDLAVKRTPPEVHAGPGVGGEMGGFRAFQAGEEIQSFRLKSLEKDHPGCRPSVFSHCGQAHGFRQRVPGGPGLFQPRRQLSHGVGMEVGPRQGRGTVFGSFEGELQGRGRPPG